ncbi:RABEP1 isoform 7, partial [Pan troglodytes]
MAQPGPASQPDGEGKGSIFGGLSERGNWDVFRLHFNDHLLHLVSGKKTLFFHNPTLLLHTEARYRELVVLNRSVSLQQRVAELEKINAEFLRAQQQLEQEFNQKRAKFK